MIINKDNVLKVINATKQELDDFKVLLAEKKKELPDIKDIKRQLTTIEKVINELQLLCKGINNTFDKEIDELNFQLLIELIDKSDILFELINNNLPNGLSLNNHEDNKNEKVAYLSKDDIEQIGTIRIGENEGKLTAVVRFYNNESSTFEINNHLRIISIVSYINMIYNYL